MNRRTALRRLLGAAVALPFLSKLGFAAIRPTTNVQHTAGETGDYEIPDEVGIAIANDIHAHLRWIVDTCERDGIPLRDIVVTWNNRLQLDPDEQHYNPEMKRGFIRLVARRSRSPLTDMPVAFPQHARTYPADQCLTAKSTA